MCTAIDIWITFFLAGKTTILYRMKRTEDFHTVPTIGKMTNRSS